MTMNGHETECILDDSNEVLSYDAASKLGTRPYDPTILEYIGDGYLVRVWEYMQTGSTRLSFFKYKR